MSDPAYTDCSSSDAATRRKAIDHIVRSMGKEGLVEILDDILQRLYDLENP